MFEACSSKSANCHGLKFWLEGGKYTTNYEVPICCTLSPWGEGTLFSEWGEGTGERVQHPGLGKVPDNREKQRKISWNYKLIAAVRFSTSRKNATEEEG